ncbi:MAG: SGNH/GDSL hydrolase family protein [Thermodesulfobacteriota bacterium]
MIEGASWLGVLVLEKKFDIRYRPSLPTKLSARHQKTLSGFLKNKYDLTGFSAELGWTVKPNANAKKGLYVTNSKGIRAKREYSLTPPADKTRITTFGDSYTFGMEVKNEDTWQEQLGELNNSLEVLNFGIGGHAPDQGYLRYLGEGAKYSADIVVIGFMSENINRIVNVYRPYYTELTGLPLTKPRFIVENNSLKLIKNPFQRLSDYQVLFDQPESVLPKLGKHDYYFHTRYAKHPLDVLRTVRLVKMANYDLLKKRTYDQQGSYNENSEGYQLLLVLLDTFYNKVKESGAEPVILIYPDFGDVIRLYSGKPKKYQLLLDWLQTKQYAHVDLMDSIQKYKKDNKVDNFFVKAHGHYSRAGNGFVAHQVNTYINDTYRK